MTQISFQDGRPVLRDGLVGTGLACCCGCRCDLDCERVTGVSVSVYGTKLGTLTFSFPSDDPDLELSAGPLCSVVGNSQQILVQLQYTEPNPAGGTSSLAFVSLSIVCGTDAGLETGEYFVNLFGSIGANGEPIQIGFSYTSITTNCRPNGLPAVDTDEMQVDYCSDLANNQDPLNPCPVRVVVEFLT